MTDESNINKKSCTFPHLSSYTRYIQPSSFSFFPHQIDFRISFCWNKRLKMRSLSSRNSSMHSSTLPQLTFTLPGSLTSTPLATTINPQRRHPQHVNACWRRLLSMMRQPNGSRSFHAQMDLGAHKAVSSQRSQCEPAFSCKGICSLSKQVLFLTFIELELSGWIISLYQVHHIVNAKNQAVARRLILVSSKVWLKSLKLIQIRTWHGLYNHYSSRKPSWNHSSRKQRLRESSRMLRV